MLRSSYLRAVLPVLTLIVVRSEPNKFAQQIEDLEKSAGLSKPLHDLAKDVQAAEKEGGRLERAAFRENAPWEKSLPGELAGDEEKVVEKVRHRGFRVLHSC